MNHIRPCMLSLILLTSSAWADEPPPAQQAQEIPSKIDADFQPAIQTDYVLIGSGLYRSPDNNPGPMEASTSIAWKYANEFVYRTALAKDYLLPSGSAGPSKSGEWEISFKRKDGKSELVVEVSLKRRVVRIP